MATRISELTAASALDGTETLPLVQGGATRRTSAASLSTGVFVATFKGVLQAGLTSMPLPFPFAGRVLRVDVAVPADKAPTGGPVTVDVDIARGAVPAATIFATQANRPTIAIGANKALNAVPDSAVAPFSAGDLLTVTIDTVGYSEPTYIDSSGGTSATGLSVTSTPAPPGGSEWAVGDVVLWNVKSVRAATITPPAGLTEIGTGVENPGGNAWGQHAYWIRLTDPIPTTWQFTQSISGFISVAPIVYRNTRTTGSPINNAGAAFSADAPSTFISTFTSSSVTTTVPGCRLVQMIQVDAARTVGSWPAGFTGRTTRISDGVQAAAGASGTKQGSYSDGSTYTARHLVALEPALGGQAAGADLTVAVTYRAS